MKSLKLCSWAYILAVSMLACTRGGDTKSLQLSIPTDSLLRSTQRDATTPLPPLQTLIANVQILGSPPLVKQMDFDGTPVAGTIDMTFGGVPPGASVLVQVLAVYASDGGAMQLRYGDAAATVSGNTQVTVDLGAAGGITKQSYVAGRLQLPDGSLPTGTLVALFQPPGTLNGAPKPKMVVDQDTIVAGWFNIFAVGGAGFTFDYLLKETGQTIFSGLNPDLSTTGCSLDSLSGACPFWVGSSPQDRIKIAKPVSYSRSGKTNAPGLQSSSQMEYVLGFFGNLAGGGKSVCYANNVWEAVPKLFSDATLSTPLDLNFNSGALATQVNVTGGGYGSTMAQIYKMQATPCMQTNISQGTGLILNHTLLGNNDKNFGGFNAPWMMVQPFSQNNSQYLNTVNNGSNIGLNWMLLPQINLQSSSVSFSSASASISSVSISDGSSLQPGMYVFDVTHPSNILSGTVIQTVSGSGSYNVTLSSPTQGSASGDILVFSRVSGIEVWAKVNDNSSYNGGNDACLNLPSRGYQLYEIVQPATTGYTFPGFSGSPVGPNVYYQLALCATTGTGTTKTYVGQPIYGQLANAGDGGQWPFGWASANPTVSLTMASSADPSSDLGIKSQLITAISVGSTFTTLTTGSTNSFVAGDEVLVRVAGQGAAGACGSTNIHSGDYAFARVLDGGSTSLWIPSGTWVDQLAAASAGNLSMAPAPGNNFCSVQAIRVPHFRDLTLAAGLAPGAINPFNFTTGQLGVVPFRVNGTFTLSGVMNLANVGFEGGQMPSNLNGAGDAGSVSSATPGSFSGAAGAGGTSSGSGGGAIGAGGTGSGLFYAGQSSGGGGSRILLGGGGGAETADSAIGGNGGGALYVGAYNFAPQAGASIMANGQTETYAAGGGGGGSINLLTFNFVPPSGAPALSANGGNGGPNGGGGGGGGYVQFLACNSPAAVTLAPTVTAGAAGSSAGSAGQGSTLIDIAGLSNQKFWCY